MENFNSEDNYYSRHYSLPDFGKNEQECLRNSNVLIIGMGGLGCPAATYLAGAGVGNITLCDADTVSISNLHRQVLYGMDSIGKKKVLEAKRALEKINPFINISHVDSFANYDSMLKLFLSYDVIIDCTDNFEAKYNINDVCSLLNKPLVYGSIFQFHGQVSVFNYGDSPITYRDLYPKPPPTSLSCNCSDAGVLGVLPGIIGCFQANEAIKIICNFGKVLSGELLTYSALDCDTNKLRIKKRANNSPNFEEKFSFSDIDDFSQISFIEIEPYIEKIVLLDVRSYNERSTYSLGGLHIPLDELEKRYSELLEIKEKIIIYCKSGLRSARAAIYLSRVLKNKRLYSLSGGIEGVPKQYYIHN